MLVGRVIIETHNSEISESGTQKERREKRQPQPRMFPESRPRRMSRLKRKGGGWESRGLCVVLASRKRSRLTSAKSASRRITACSQDKSFFSFLPLSCDERPDENIVNLERQDLHMIFLSFPMGRLQTRSDRWTGILFIHT